MSYEEIEKMIIFCINSGKLTESEESCLEILRMKHEMWNRLSEKEKLEVKRVYDLCQ